MVTITPLHRSGQAALPHPASCLGGDGESHEGMGWQMRQARSQKSRMTSEAASRSIRRVLAATPRHLPSLSPRAIAVTTQARAGMRLMPPVRICGGVHG